MRRIAILALAVLAFVVPSAWAVTADDALDICAADADPCVITTEFDLADGSTLDFGTRAVQITGNGLLDTNINESTILCGAFRIDTGTTIGLKIRGGNGLGGIDGGTLTIHARRRCSLDSERTCLGDVGCDFGSCSLKVCSGDTTRTCVSEENCNFGTCEENSRCSGDFSRECLGNADCTLGSCSVDVCSGNRATECSSNADCDFGACDDGDGEIEIGRSVRADGQLPGAFFLRAAGDIDITNTVTAASSSVDNDGGVIDIESGNGNVTINSTLTATGGSFATGGEICLIAGQDVVVNQNVDASGGDFDGGFVELDSGRDVLINRSVFADSNNGGGFGGEVAVAAQRDVVVTSPATVEADGHFASVDNFGGDGGAVELAAEEDVSVGAGTILTATGAEPDGFGGEILIESEANTAIAGTLTARTADAATQGAGGNVDLDIGGTFTFPAGALIDVRGAANGAGAVFGVTGGNATLGGIMDARAGSGGAGDGISLDLGGNVNMTGQLRVSGTADGQLNGQIDVEFCRMTMASGARIENSGGFGKNILRARERLTMNAGSTLVADSSTGLNRLIYRDEAKPPVLNGTITPPAAPNDINEFLTGCPVCGNDELDGGETCEDGNTDNGDGCSSDCQDEGCIADTPGYPDVPLCDDGDGCTIDTCAASSCSSVASCDDGIDCTSDVCNAQQECAHTASNAFCDDENECTNDICSVGARGCVSVDNTDTCDDGVACTINDRCSDGVCSGGANCPDGEICNPESGQCQVGGGCGDGNVDGTDECDDGDTTWEAGDSCNATCQIVACGDPDDTGTTRASDALFILRAAVGSESCVACVCNVDSNPTGSPVSASDALRVLRAAVGNPVEIVCPACS